MNTYSFTDVVATISHPGVGQITATGEGLGSIGITMSTDRTAHDVASDGNVMTSKIKARNGVVALAIQQTSALNSWLKKWFNYLEAAPASEWANTKIVIRGITMGDYYLCTGVAPQKQADQTYQAQGQQITWNLMAADIQQE